MAGEARLGAIHHQILNLLRSHPDGLTIYEIRNRIPEIDVQQHLDKRVRELRKYFNVPWNRASGPYVYKGERADAAPDSGAINKTLRAAVLNAAHGRCRMCGRTVAGDGIKLEVDHKLPRNWGGKTEIDNLWALCQLCNGGKRDFFASMDTGGMRKIVHLKSVYERIAATLRMHKGAPVPSWLLEFVANVSEFQEDWQKRLRELRYPVIGMKIVATRAKTSSGKWQAAYKLEKWVPLPHNHKSIIKEYERKRKRRVPPTKRTMRL